MIMIDVIIVICVYSTIMSVFYLIINPGYVRMDFDFWEEKNKKYVILEYHDGKNKAVDITGCAGFREIAIEILKYLNGAR